jgi:hypothetical protein
MQFALTIAIVVMAGGPVEFTGERPRVWTSRCVVVAEIEATKIIGKAEDGSREIVVRPIATLAGDFDPTAISTLKLHAHTHPRTSDLGEIPEVGTTAIILFRAAKNAQGITEYAVHPGTVKFFPNRSPAIHPVKGLGDPQIAETVERLRKLRMNLERVEQAKRKPNS